MSKLTLLTEYVSTILIFLRLIFLIYYIITISFRLCFLPGFNIFQSSIGVIIFDYIVDTFYIIDTIFPYLRHLKIQINKIVPEKQTKVSQPKSHKKRGSVPQIVLPTNTKHKLENETIFIFNQNHYEYMESIFRIIYQIIMLFPIEVIGYAAGMEYYEFLRLFRLLRIIYWNQYWYDLAEFLRMNKIIVNTDITRVFYILLISMNTIHVSACLYYILAISLLHRHKPNWLKFDHDATYGTNGNVILLHSVYYRYLRALYWSTETFSTSAYGDIAAYSPSETWYVIFYTYMAAFASYMSVAALIIVIQTYDSTRTDLTRKVEKFNKYAKYRKLPIDLVNQVRAYYSYQWDILKGVNENLILSELPPNLSQQVLQYVVCDLLVKINLFKDLKKSILNTLSEKSESYIYSPNEIIIEKGSDVAGAYVICAGEVLIVNEAGKKQYFRTGELFLGNALFNSIQATEQYRAQSFVEVLLIRRSIYQSLCQLYLKREEIETMRRTFISDGNKIGFRPNLTNLNKTNKSNKQRKSIFNKISGFKRRSVEFVSTSDALSKIGFKKYFIPGADFRLIWDCTILLGMIFYMISCGLLLSACLRNNFLPHYLGLLITCYCVDVIFFIDFIFRAVLFGFENQGITVSKSELIFGRFLATEKLMLTFLSIFPFDIIIAVSIPDYRIIPIIRLLKLLHMSNTLFYITNFTNLLRIKLGIVMSFEFGRFLILYISLFFLCHWMATFYQLAADCGVKIFGYSISWRVADINSDFYRVKYNELSNTAFYIRSLYCVISIMSSIAFADILPQNPVDVIAVIIIMFFGVVMFNTLLGAIASLMESFNNEERIYATKIDKFREFVKFKNIPTETEVKVLRYYEYNWAKCRGINDIELMGDLPKSLQISIRKHLFAHHIDKIPFFRLCSESLLQYLLMIFKPRIFLHDDALMLCGEYGKEMFIIDKGEVIVTSKNKELVFAKLSDGAYIGESCLLENSIRTASVYAVNFLDTYYLTRDIFLKISSKFPSEYEIIVEMVDSSLKEKVKANAKLKKDFTQSISDHNSLSLEMSKKIKSSQLDIMKEVIVQNFDYLLSIFNLSNWSKNKIFPESNFKLGWDVLIFSSLCYYAIVIPMRLVMNKLSMYLFIASYIFDVLNWIDSYLYFTAMAQYVDGQLISINTDIRSNYMRSNRLKIDLLSEFPYDVIAIPFISADFFYMMLALLRIPKLIKLIILPDYFKQVKRLSQKLNINTYLFKFIELSISVFVFVYWVAIGFYALAKFRATDSACLGVSDDIISCKYRNTWVYQQINAGKLPENVNNNQWAVLLRACQWSISSLTARLGDVRIMNAEETLYAFLVLFFGLVINGKITGNIMGIVSDANEEVTEIYQNIEILQKYLKENNVGKDVIEKSISLLRHQASTEGSLALNQEHILSDLPKSIQKSIDIQLKFIPFLRGCPIFDHCSDEFLLDISVKLHIQLYIKGDKIIHAGELGYEMFFIENGMVDVVSVDEKTKYSTLENGSFFGEAALFGNTIRSANIVVSSVFCKCFVLTKADFRSELSTYGLELSTITESFQILQKRNAERNANVTRNLLKAENKHSKLNRVLGIKEPPKVNFFNKLRQVLNPDSYFRVIWDTIGLLFLLYYIFSIILYIAFIFGEKIDIYLSSLVYFDSLVGTYFSIDIILKANFFSYKLNLLQDQLVIDREAIWSNYRNNGHFYLDSIASIPLEFLNVILQTPIYRFSPSLIHLIRVSQIPEYFDLLEYHIYVIFGWSAHRTIVLIVKTWFLLIVMNHWLACGYFCIHRYLENDVSDTYVTMDPVGLASYDSATGKNDICSKAISYCYARSVYFVINTMTTMSYGDISPWQNREYFYQFAVTLIGAFLAALCTGVCDIYLRGNDRVSNASFYKKIKQIEAYCDYRKLKPELKDSILVQYNYIWTKFKSLRTNRMDILDHLSPPCRNDISRFTQKDMIELVPILSGGTYPAIIRRIAQAFRPQASIAGSKLYRAGGISNSIWFVTSGVYSISLTNNSDDLDTFGMLAYQLLLYKQCKHGKQYRTGDHFGNTSLLSKTVLCSNDATAFTDGEVYELSKEDLWKIFLYVNIEQRRSFLYQLFTFIGDVKYLNYIYDAEDDLASETQPIYNKQSIAMNDDNKVEDKIQSMFRMANQIIEKLDQMISQDKEWQELLIKHNTNEESDHRLEFKMLQRLSKNVSISTESYRDRLFAIEDAVFSNSTNSNKGKRNSKIRINRQKTQLSNFEDEIENSSEVDSNDDYDRNYISNNHNNINNNNNNNNNNHHNNINSINQIVEDSSEAGSYFDDDDNNNSINQIKEVASYFENNDTNNNTNNNNNNNNVDQITEVEDISEEALYFDINNDNNNHNSNVNNNNDNHNEHLSLSSKFDNLTSSNDSEDYNSMLETNRQNSNIVIPIMKIIEENSWKLDTNIVQNNDNFEDTNIINSDNQQQPEMNISNKNSDMILKLNETRY